MKAGEYPKDVTDFDGVLITGSLSGVYEDEPWIHRLLDVRTTTLLVMAEIGLWGCLVTWLLSAGNSRFEQEKGEDGGHKLRTPSNCTSLGWSRSSKSEGDDLT